MRKLSNLETVRMNEENNLFGNDKMTDLEKIVLYCKELISADLIPDMDENTDEIRENLDESIGEFIKGAIGLLNQIESIEGAGFLPEDTEGSFPEPEEIKALLLPLVEKYTD